MVVAKEKAASPACRNFKHALMQPAGFHGSLLEHFLGVAPRNATMTMCVRQQQQCRRLRLAYNLMYRQTKSYSRFPSISFVNKFYAVKRHGSSRTPPHIVPSCRELQPRTQNAAGNGGWREIISCPVTRPFHVAAATAHSLPFSPPSHHRNSHRSDNIEQKPLTWAYELLSRNYHPGNILQKSTA